MVSRDDVAGRTEPPDFVGPRAVLPRPLPQGRLVLSARGGRLLHALTTFLRKRAGWVEAPPAPFSACATATLAAGIGTDPGESHRAFARICRRKNAGRHVGCETSLCGACTVLVVQAEGRGATTIEGLPQDGASSTPCSRASGSTTASSAGTARRA